jgi:hypothetical protein
LEALLALELNLIEHAKTYFIFFSTRQQNLLDKPSSDIKREYFLILQKKYPSYRLSLNGTHPLPPPSPLSPEGNEITNTSKQHLRYTWYNIFIVFMVFILFAGLVWCWVVMDQERREQLEKLTFKVISVPRRLFIPALQ